MHCTVGSSRAPTAVMSYLIGMKKLPLLDAFNYVTLIRPCVNPNRKFLLQLAQFEVSFLFLEHVHNSTPISLILQVDQGEGCSVFYHKQWRFYEFNTFRTADIEIRTKLGLTNTLLKLYEESAAGDNLLLE